MTNALFYGDNLDVLRKAIPNESIDLIYLDPPFNSNASYNVLFRAPSGNQSQAQIEAFEDTWHWTADNGAELAFDEVMHSGNAEAANMLKAIRSFLGENDMMAYVTMMAVRLLELHRVLKPTGSLYLHCDPTASHYLKILLDAVFSPENYRAELTWRRTNARGTTGMWPRIHDTIFCYTKSKDFTFHSLKVKADKAKTPHTLISGPDGLKYQTFELTGAGMTKAGESGTAWRGFDPNKYGRHWGSSHKQMDEWDKAGLIHWPKEGGFPRRLADQPFDPEEREVTVGDVWTDIDRLNQTAKERLGYPTQKPLALLERIICASCNEGDLVLDPFCGCGTAVHAAEKLKRRWIGIDITHLAIGLIERRLKDAFPGIKFDIHGTPNDFAGAEDLAKRDKFQFQWWAVGLVNAVPYGGKKKGADTGIDGYYHCKPDGKKTEAGIVSVKGGETLHRDMVSDLRGVMEREEAPFALMVTLREPTAPMVKEAAAAGFFDTPFGKFPRLQIATVSDMLAGKLPKLPPQEKGAGYRQAGLEEMAKQYRLI